jgi:hypothetical protein
MAPGRGPPLLGHIPEHPFVILGLIVVIIFCAKASAAKKEGRPNPFRFMWLAVTVSFAFYIPVVLWADVYPLLGMLMLPKTCAYVWMVVMGYKLPEARSAAASTKILSHSCSVKWTS